MYKSREFKLLFVLISCCIFALIVHWNCKTTNLEQLNDQQLMAKQIIMNESNKHQKINKYIFDDQSIISRCYSNNLTLNKVNGCGPGNGYGIDLIIIVYSLARNLEARLAIRDTWGAHFVERGSYLYFLIGKSIDDIQQNQIEMENIKYGDILQASYLPDDVDTLKSIVMLKYLNDYCSKVRWILKTTDSDFINSQQVTYYSETSTKFSKTIVGNLAKDWKVPMNKRNSYYLPKYVYPYCHFPDFVIGPVYLFTGNSISLLYQQLKINVDNLLKFEDVFITGIVADEAEVRRIGDRRLWNFKSIINNCNFRLMWVSQKHSPKEIRHLWKVAFETPCPINH